MAIQKATILSIFSLLIGAPSASLGFVPPSQKIDTTYMASFSSSSSSALHATRRNFLQQTTTAIATSAIIGTGTTAAPLPSFAKEKEPVTRELVTATFASIESELTSPSGVIPTLSDLIDKGSFPEIMQFTKESDAYFRKAKLGKARKLLTEASVKDGALQLSNAVTFDLIGMNRASRPGRESQEEARRYLEELRGDVKKFLELEKTIVLEGE